MENKKLQTALDKWQAIQPISPRDRERLSRRFTIDFNYNSNHIEGNTLTYGQTESKILRELRTEPVITFAYLQEEIGINRSAIQKMLQSLQNKGYIQKDENGKWRVFITPSR